MNRNAALLLLLFAAAIATGRWRTYDEPLERDITIYAVIGREMLAGRALYSDLWDIKPPAIYATFAAAQALTGPGRPAVLLLNVMAALATLAALFAIGRRLAGEAAGLWAAGFWTVVCGDLNLWANQPNTEAFINACAAGGVALWMAADGRARRTAWLLGAGALFAWATLYKQIVVVIPAAITLARLLASATRDDRRRAWMDAALLASAGALTWALAFGWFAATGRFGVFWDTLYGYGRYYAGSPWANLAQSFLPAGFPRGFFAVAGPLAALLIIGAAFIGRGKKRHFWMTVAPWCVGAHLAVALPGKFFPHYHQLWLPPLCLGAGWAVATLWHDNKPWRRRAGRVMAFIAIAWLLVHEGSFYRLSPDEWSRRKYGEIFLHAERLGRAIDELLEPEETFFQWGDETGLFFAGGRRPTTGVLYETHMTSGPLAPALSERALRDIERRPPDLFVLLPWVLDKVPDGHPVLDYFAERYAETADTYRHPPFELYVREDSPLRARMEMGLFNSETMP